MIEWVLGWLWWAWASVTAVVAFALDFLVGWAWRNPVAAAAALFGFIRMWGTTVQTGQAGVLFAWGRPVKILEPGFHALIPLFQTVRVLPARSVTLAPPPQRVTTADGLVFDAEATLVFRISDPIKATVEVDDLRAGCLAALALAVAHVVGHKTRPQLAAKGGLDGELRERVQETLTAWGVTVEQAGFNTIAPTRTTTRLTQQANRVRERAAALAILTAAGVPTETALALLGTTRQVIGHSRARYHRHRLKPRPDEAPPPVIVFVEAEEEAALGDLPA